MSVFRHPRTQNERKGDQQLQSEQDGTLPIVKARRRSGRRGTRLPTERSDLLVSARGDRGRGQRRTRDHRE